MLLTFGFSNVNAWFNASVIAVLCGLLISLFEVYLFRKPLRHLKFYWVFVIRTGVYLFSMSSILFHVSLFSRMYRFHLSYKGVLASEEFKVYLYDGRFLREVVYITIFALIIHFTRMMNRKMGQGMLWSYISGEYYESRQVNQVFLFLRIKNSGNCLKNLGHFKYHEFLNQFYYRISESILKNGGNIYEYVEDLVVVRWNSQSTTSLVNGLNTFLNISKSIDKMKVEYYEEFGFIPEIEAALHGGSVVGAEIGELKTQIVYHGDTLNTTSRILDQCGVLGHDFLLSEEYKNRIERKIKVVFDPVGNIELKGKSKPMALYGLSENTVLR